MHKSLCMIGCSSVCCTVGLRYLSILFFFFLTVSASTKETWGFSVPSLELLVHPTTLWSIWDDVETINRISHFSWKIQPSELGCQERKVTRRTALSLLPPHGMSHLRNRVPLRSARDNTQVKPGRILDVLCPKDLKSVHGQP